ncbi:23S rRNA (cytidine1920-2'-O)/16S rRNA (cytidine1409-2'-O)-methyltransferase [Alteribacillus persepolensis]|uniref:23S rRNA (Cytidine1920-2'-O)/16S rRNA (Cytidine1409-2'-O)-methyltransferase n=1 Tax=Alteribacillus persepolensis TaxID=568899 RepID=A0A1G8D1P6_9BACI|nr:TlyA family RNA methyltransferase [Alteribacillus persepolensis]SDH51444.1 23S rRNA (cytidine1920-2'-O)/16S rRNA (cytidine1409-2'-O)-methyltransferase [Alteribacillus persepolensis]
MKKERIDVLLVEKGYFDSREKAKRSIMAGLVLADEERIDKPGMKVDTSINIRIKGQETPYVSRGGLKLEKALQVFPLEMKDKLVLDIGASTGGFTDCALQNGAQLVYAVDVGYNQLSWKLRQHEQVEVMERYNFRYAKMEDFKKGAPNVAVADVSFISLKLLLPPLTEILEENSSLCLLIKPQFEAGKDKVGKKGVVRDKQTHHMVISDILSFASSLGFTPQGLDFSPITGGDGNIEFLLFMQWLSDNARTKNNLDQDIQTVVNNAHQQFQHVRRSR